MGCYRKQGFGIIIEGNWCEFTRDLRHDKRYDMQLLNICKSKIHRATVTESNVDYMGSITVDQELMDRAGLKVGELVHVWNVSNANRFETYVIPGAAGSGTICINGAAAHLCKPGDKVIIVAFVLTDEEIVPKMILVDEKNRYVRSI
jgi:aspartate 1-decarboxylase